MTDEEHHDREPIDKGSAGPGPDDGPPASMYAGLGLQLFASILLFLYIGQWLDRRFGTKGIFTVVGVLFGAGAAFFGVYRRLMADQRRRESRRR